MLLRGRKAAAARLRIADFFCAAYWWRGRTPTGFIGAAAFTIYAPD